MKHTSHKHRNHHEHHKNHLMQHFSDMHHTLNQWLSPHFLPPLLQKENWLKMKHWMPSIDMKEEPNKFCISADLPGVDMKNIDISVDNGMLTIRGHKEKTIKEKHKNYMHTERAQGHFYRCIALPTTANTSKISAKCKNGVLEITVPKNKITEKQHKKVKVRTMH